MCFHVRNRGDCYFVFPDQEVAVGNEKLIGYLFTLGEVAQVCLRLLLLMMFNDIQELLTSYSSHSSSAPPTPLPMCATLCRASSWPVLNVKVCMVVY